MARMDKAVILARGLGTRMRKQDQDAKLTEQQAKIADAGIKALIPIDRPFLDYVLHALAEAGYKDVCLVIGPEHQAVRDYYNSLKTTRVKVHYGIQEKPLGTANAVLGAEEFAGNDPFLVINSDNYYPPASLKGLREIDTPGLAGFEKNSMLAGSNIPADRIAKFAIVQVDAKGRMLKIIEKPTPEQLAAIPEPQYVSMNCWRFNASIFAAARAIKPSARGEYELPDAVIYSIETLGETYQVVPVKAPVLDLSSRSDVEAVAAKLKGSEINL
jgi:dTDP-glucose pyrophosphorylase